jgi:hypothetical protein
MLTTAIRSVQALGIHNNRTAPPWRSRLHSILSSRPQNRTDQQQVSPVPVALLAMWMPRI